MTQQQFTLDQIRVCKNLFAIADKYALVPGPVHLMVCYQESGWNEAAFNAADPNGGSKSVYQINGIHAAFAVADDPGFDYGYWAIHRDWATAWAKVGGWYALTSNPLAFILDFAPRAQGSDHWSVAEGQAALDATYAMIVLLGR